jgi:cysteine synthase A
MTVTTVVDAIGRTPLVRLRFDDNPDVAVFAKLEMQNLYGMKDRVARNVILEARRTGVLAERAPIIESSSGTMALGVALVGSALGHEVHIVTDPRVDRITLAKLRALGCHVHIVAAMSGNGWQSARLERLAELRETMPGAFWPDQYGNPDNPGGYRFLAEEVLEELGHFDVLVGSVGSGGSLCGSARAFRRSLPGLRIVGVDSVGSVLFGQPDVPGRKQSGLGNSLLPRNLDRDLVDEVHWLNDREAFEATRALAREQQLFGGNTSGSVYRVLKHLAGTAEPGTRIVGILPDRGDRYADTVYSDEYWAEHGIDRLDVTSSPREVAPGTAVSSWARSRPPRHGGQKHLLFIESNTTGTGMRALHTARESGFAPVLVTSAPQRYAGLEDVGCEVLPCDTNDIADLRREITARFRREELAGITTTSEFYTVVTAELAEWLGMAGDSRDSVSACRDKSALRRVLAEAGVPQPAFAVVRSPGTVADAVAAVGLPCVVKPVDDTGSTNVRLCHSHVEVEEHVAALLRVQHNVRGQRTVPRVLVEQLLRGPEFSVELFGDGDRTTCVGITAKQVTGGPWFVETGHVHPAPLDDAAAHALERAAMAAVDATGIRFGATHTELVLTSSGPAVVEVNPRPAGGMIPELVRLTTGIDLVEQHLRLAGGLPVALRGQPRGTAAIRFLVAEGDGVVTEVRGVDEARAVEGVHAVVVHAKPGALVRPPRDAYDRLGHVIALGSTAAEAVARCTRALGSLRVVLAGQANEVRR